MILNEQGGVHQEFAHYPGTDRPHSVRTGDGTIYYYLTDDPGNVIGTVNSANQVVEQMKYTPFGTFEFQTITVAPLAYRGALLDEGATYYLRNRGYDPDLQRFLSEDPIGLAGGINPYTFVGNSLMEGRDPTGLAHCTALHESLNKSDGSHGCGGTPVSFTPLVVTATPKTQTVNVGSTSRGYTGTALNSGSGRYGSIGSGGSGGSGGAGYYSPGGDQSLFPRPESCSAQDISSLVVSEAVTSGVENGIKYGVAGALGGAVVGPVTFGTSAVAGAVGGAAVGITLGFFEGAAWGLAWAALACL